MDTLEPIGYALPDGSRIYAIGDIHGRDDLFGKLIGLIASDNVARGKASVSIVFLGDYIDRGPGSKDVVDRLLKLRSAGPEIIFLKGNHEDLFLKFMADPESAAGSVWFRNGAAATLLSYGLDRDLVQNAGHGDAGALKEAALAGFNLMPSSHLAFYRGLHTHLAREGYFFVHGGVRPGVALPDQQEQDLLWIRDEFLTSPVDFGAIVVHGHTPSPHPQSLRNRIGIDTLAWKTGKLTAVGLQGRDRWFLSTV